MLKAGDHEEREERNLRACGSVDLTIGPTASDSSMDRLRFTQHISRQFNQELEAVRSHVLRMGGLVEQQLGVGVRCLREREVAGLKLVAEAEAEINRLELSIDEECVRIMVRRQPAASDLRLLLMAGKTVADLERMGDESTRVAKLAARLVAGPFEPRYLDELAALGQVTRAMLRGCLDAFARGDVAQARRVMAEDKVADRSYKAQLVELAEYMERLPAIIPAAIDALFVARSLERVGDHCKNICEQVIYLVRGEDVRHPKSRREGDEAVAESAPSDQQGGV